MSEVKSYLDQGYRRENPLPIKVSTEVEQVINQATGQDSDQATDQATGQDNSTPLPANAVRINHDSTSKLAKGLPGLGTAVLRSIKDSRPYTCIEDLIERVPLEEKQSWTSYESRIVFD